MFTRSPCGMMVRLLGQAVKLDAMRRAAKVAFRERPLSMVTVRAISSVPLHCSTGALPGES